VELVVLEVAGQRYGLPLMDTDEVLSAVQITALPKAPRIIEGVINVRGAVVPVLDLRARFSLPAKALDVNEQLVVARAGSRRVAVRADRVVGLASVDNAQVTPGASISQHADYVVGVAKLADGLALIHDLAGFLTAAEAETLDEAMAARALRMGTAL
jgi:purine-binding chemotaxis protein CheW